MAVSPNTSFDLTRTGIIRTAYQLCGVVPAGQDPDTNQLVMGTDFLNMELKALQGKGIILRTVDETQVSLVSGTAEYALAASTLDVDSRTPFISDGNGNDYPIQVISRGMYDKLTDKGTLSQPTQMYIERGTTISLFLYPVPDGNWPTLTVQRVTLLTDMDSAEYNTGLQAKYLRGIVFWLASDLAFHHGLLEKQRVLKAEYEQAVSEAVNDDNERSPVKFVPRYGYRFGRSR